MHEGHTCMVCNQHLVGLPLKINAMHRMQSDHVHLDLLQCITNETYGKAQLWNKNI